MPVDENIPNKVAGLRERLSKEGLKTSGRKADLIKRLKAYIKQKKAEEAEEAEAAKAAKEAEEKKAAEPEPEPAASGGGGKEEAPAEEPKEACTEEETVTKEAHSEETSVSSKVAHSEETSVSKAEATSEETETVSEETVTKIEPSRLVEEAEHQQPVEAGASSSEAPTTTAPEPEPMESDAPKDESSGSRASKLEAARKKRLKKRARQKAAKARIREEEAKVTAAITKKLEDAATDDIVVEYISDRTIQHDEMAADYVKTFERFISAELLTMDKAKRAALEEQQARQDQLYEPKEEFDDSGTKAEDGEDEEKKPLSNKQKKKLHRLKIAELKRLVDRPEIVEEHDCNAADPRLLIFLKSVRNTVPVPVHWCDTKKYLQGKRGFEKPPFELPSFIAATGITQIRDRQLLLGADSKSKSKQRARMRPKRGGLGIDYQVLHDAFFRHQTKPKNMTTFGDLYHEGKEFELKFRKFKPGVISDKLKKALHMQCRYRVVAQQGVAVQTLSEEGEWRDVTMLQYNTLVDWEDDNKDGDRIKISHPAKGWVLKKHPQTKQNLIQRLNVDSPPPWLISMQRFGPPPAYPEVQIPGLNAPIPPWCKYGFADGQWGKPPVDRTGRPLYGDPFGVWQPEEVYQAMMLHDVPLWAPVEDVESSDEEDASSDDDDDDTTTTTGTHEPSGPTEDTSTLPGVASASTGPGTSSVTSSLSGLESEQSTVNLRKGVGTDTPESSNQQLYVELQKQRAGKQQGIFGTAHTYKMGQGGMAPGKPQAGGVQLALNPEEMANMDEATLRRKYEEQERQKRQRNADGADDEPRKKRRSRFGEKRDEYDVRF